MLKTTFYATVLLAFTAVTSSAADFGDLAGTYSGKTAKGGDIVISIPKNGTPTYRFRGESVSVSSASAAGKGVKMTVGSGGGTVTLTPAGKGKLAYRYAFNGDTASATLTKQ